MHKCTHIYIYVCVCVCVSVRRRSVPQSAAHWQAPTRSGPAQSSHPKRRVRSQCSTGCQAVPRGGVADWLSSTCLVAVSCGALAWSREKVSQFHEFPTRTRRAVWMQTERMQKQHQLSRSLARRRRMLSLSQQPSLQQRNRVAARSGPEPTRTSASITL